MSYIVNISRMCCDYLKGGNESLRSRLRWNTWVRCQMKDTFKKCRQHKNIWKTEDKDDHWRKRANNELHRKSTWVWESDIVQGLNFLSIFFMAIYIFVILKTEIWWLYICNDLLTWVVLPWIYFYPFLLNNSVGLCEGKGIQGFAHEGWTEKVGRYGGRTQAGRRHKSKSYRQNLQIKTSSPVL